MTVEILPDGLADLIAGFNFYERLGQYFLDSLFADIDLLASNAGIHAKAFAYQRSLSHRFPFAIYYRVEGEVVGIRAVLDCRRKPSWIRQRLDSA